MGMKAVNGWPWLVLLTCGSVLQVACQDSRETRADKASVRATPVAPSQSVRWRGEKKKSQLLVGPHTIAIPADWRDASELDMPGYVAPDRVSMTPATDANGATRTMIVLGWAALQNGNLDPRDPPCVPLATMFEKTYAAKVSNVSPLRIGEDNGCGMTAVNKDFQMEIRVGFQDGHQLLALWTRERALGDKRTEDDLRVWRDVLAQLHFSN